MTTTILTVIAYDWPRILFNPKLLFKDQIDLKEISEDHIKIVAGIENLKLNCKSNMHDVPKSQVFNHVFDMHIKTAYDVSVFEDEFEDDDGEEYCTKILVVEVEEVETKYSAQKKTFSFGQLKKRRA